MTDGRAGALAAAGAAVLFGSSFVATAVALRSFGPIAIATWRGIGAALVLVGMVLIGGFLERVTPGYDAATGRGTENSRAPAAP